MVVDAKDLKNELEKKELVGQQLSSGLQGTYEQRLEEKKTIVLTFYPGKKPEVIFTGFWTGKFLKAALGSISKAYRVRRYKPIRLQATEVAGDSKPPNGGKE